MVDETNFKIKNLQIENENLKRQLVDNNLQNSTMINNKIDELLREKEELLSKIKRLEIENEGKQPSHFENYDDERWKETLRLVELYKGKLKEKESEIDDLKGLIENLKDVNQEMKIKLNEREVLNNFNNDQR